LSLRKIVLFLSNNIFIQRSFHEGMVDVLQVEEVEIITKKGEQFKGILLPSPDPKIITIKLKSGYNINIDKKYATNIKKLGKITIPRQKREFTQDPSLPKIAILHTGGTVAAEVDYATGAVTTRFTPDELIGKFPELSSLVNIDSRLMSNMWSGDMRFAHYNKMAKEIELEIKKGVEGIIITHGTDTMHYTAAALSFMLQDLPIPIILVGSQRSSDRGSTDAFLNLVSAALFIVKTDFAGVALCMHENANDDDCIILPSLKSKKLHASRRDAFKAVNAKPIARVNYAENLVQMLVQDHKRRDRNAQLKLLMMDPLIKVGIVRAHPNLFAVELAAYKSFDGLIIEGTGLGHMSVSKIDDVTVENEKILLEVTKLAKKMPVVMTSQTVFGRVNMNIYSYGRKLQAAGVIGNYNDMTTETAFIKLAFLLSQKKSLEEIRVLMGENMHGELSKRILP